MDGKTRAELSQFLNSELYFIAKEDKRVAVFVECEISQLYLVNNSVILV